MHAHLGDFIEEDGATIRQAQLARFVAISASEAAPGVPKELRFEERFSQGPTVNRNKRLGRARRISAALSADPDFAILVDRQGDSRPGPVLALPDVFAAARHAYAALCGYRRMRFHGWK